jgi:hypothetical protein
MRLKFTTLIFVISCFSIFSQSQDSIPKEWELSATPSLLANQSTFSNWQAGGVNSLSFSGQLDLSANYDKDRLHWHNSFKIGYGQQYQEATDWRKTDDMIELRSQLAKGIDEKQFWRYVIDLSFITQAAEGIDYTDEQDPTVTSNWLAPAYLNVGLGIQYKPTSYFELGFEPISAKLTIVNDQRLADLGTYGNEAATLDANENVLSSGKKLRSEFGATLKMKFEKEVIKNVTYNTNLILFSNYQENPQNVDVMWNNEIKFKVNEVINFSFNIDLIYDDDITIDEKNSDGSTSSSGPRLQLKQLMGVGVSYKFNN